MAFTTIKIPAIDAIWTRAWLITVARFPARGSPVRMPPNSQFMTRLTTNATTVSVNRTESSQDQNGTLKA